MLNTFGINELYYDWETWKWSENPQTILTHEIRNVKKSGAYNMPIDVIRNIKCDIQRENLKKQYILECGGPKFSSRRIDHHIHIHKAQY